jgi:hypothetical protein
MLLQLVTCILQTFHFIYMYIVIHNVDKTHSFFSKYPYIFHIHDGMDNWLSVYNQLLQYFSYIMGLWSNGSWIYNYLSNQCLSPLMLWVLIPLRWGVLDTTLIKFVSDLRQVGDFLWVLRFSPPIKLTGMI